MQQSNKATEQYGYRSRADFKLASPEWETDSSKIVMKTNNPRKLPAQSFAFLADNEALPKLIPPKALVPPRFARPKMSTRLNKLLCVTMDNRAEKWIGNVRGSRNKPS